MLRIWLIRLGEGWVLFLFFVLIAEQISYAEKQVKKAPKDISEYEWVVTHGESIVADKDLLDIYVRAMRYQTAGQDIVNYLNGSAGKPSDYLTIAVRNMQVGEKSELPGYIKKVYERRSKETLQIQRNESCQKGESCSLSYDVKWAEKSVAAAQLDYPSLDGVDQYVTFDLTVSYKGKSVSHSGFILHYQDASSNNVFFVYDGIIPHINEVALDRLPLTKARKPKYGKTFQQLSEKEEVKELKATKAPGWGPVPEIEEGIIGQLPGDDQIYADEFTKQCEDPPTCPFTPIEPVPDVVEGSTEGLVPAALTGISCMQTAIAQAPYNGTFNVTWGYRPEAYNEHIVEVYNKYQQIDQMNGPECASVRANVQAEYDHHGPFAAPPSPTSNHMDGTAFDAAWTPSDAPVDTLASENNCGISRCVAGDDPHWCVN